MRRLHAVEELQARIAAEINAGLLGTVQEVLVEGRQEGEDRTVYSGRNRGNKLVHFQAPDGSPPELGVLVSVKVTKTTPWSLQGHPASVGEAAAVPA